MAAQIACWPRWIRRSTATEHSCPAGRRDRPGRGPCSAACAATAGAGAWGSSGEPPARILCLPSHFHCCWAARASRGAQCRSGAQRAVLKRAHQQKSRVLPPEDTQASMSARSVLLPMPKGLCRESSTAGFEVRRARSMPMALRSRATSSDDGNWHAAGPLERARALLPWQPMSEFISSFAPSQRVAGASTASTFSGACSRALQAPHTCRLPRASGRAAREPPT